MLKNNKLDEMQEQKLLKIEHNGCWGAFWGLLAAMVIQLLTGAEPQAVAGEWLVFMALALYMGVACMHAGIWDRRLSNSWKVNLVISLIAALCVGLFQFAFTYLRYHEPVGSLWGAAILTGVTFVLCFAAISIAGRITKKRQAALNSEPEEDEEQAGGKP